MTSTVVAATTAKPRPFAPAGIVLALRERRLHLGRTYDQVAAIMGVGSTTVWAWERGMRSPDAHMLEAWATALDTTIHVHTHEPDIDDVAIERACAGTYPWARLTTTERVAAVRQLLAGGWTRSSISRHFGIGHLTVANYATGAPRPAGRPRTVTR